MESVKRCFFRYVCTRSLSEIPGSQKGGVSRMMKMTMTPIMVAG